MIEEVKMYTVVCDNCGKDNGCDSDFSCWNDESAAWEQASECGWTKEKDKHYCQDCWSYDDNDNVIIKTLP